MAHRKVDAYIHIFLTSPIVGSEWSLAWPGRFALELRAPITDWIRGWVGPRTGLNELSPGLEHRPSNVSSS
jgi:hypothetical protein